MLSYSNKFGCKFRYNTARFLVCSVVNTTTNLKLHVSLHKHGYEPVNKFILLSISYQTTYLTRIVICGRRCMVVFWRWSKQGTLEYRSIIKLGLVLVHVYIKVVTCNLERKQLQ